MSQIINGREMAAEIRAEVAEALSNETSIIVGHLLVPSLLYITQLNIILRPYI